MTCEIGAAGVARVHLRRRSPASARSRASRSLRLAQCQPALAGSPRCPASRVRCVAYRPGRRRVGGCVQLPAQQRPHRRQALGGGVFVAGGLVRPAIGGADGKRAGMQLKNVRARLV